jgi:hypothetical protein
MILKKRKIAENLVNDAHRNFHKFDLNIIRQKPVFKVNESLKYAVTNL